MAVFKEVSGNLIYPTTFLNRDVVKPIFLGHSTNALGVMGGGVALGIRNEYPEVYQQYLSYCKGSNPEALLGQAQVCRLDYLDNILVANLFGQLNIGTSKRQTNYEALYVSLVNLKEMIKAHPDKNFHDADIAFPENLGSGLGGGNWNIIYTMIKEVFKDTAYTIYIVKYIS